MPLTTKSLQNFPAQTDLNPQQYQQALDNIRNNPNLSNQWNQLIYQGYDEGLDPDFTQWKKTGFDPEQIPNNELFKAWMKEVSEFIEEAYFYIPTDDDNDDLPHYLDSPENNQSSDDIGQRPRRNAISEKPIFQNSDVDQQQSNTNNRENQFQEPPEQLQKGEQPSQNPRSKEQTQPIEIKPLPSPQTQQLQFDPNQSVQSSQANQPSVEQTQQQEFIQQKQSNNDESENEPEFNQSDNLDSRERGNTVWERDGQSMEFMDK